jgi:hypothetical protein
VGLDSFGFGYEPVVGICEHGTFSSTGLQGREFFDCLSDC